MRCAAQGRVWEASAAVRHQCSVRQLHQDAEAPIPHQDRRQLPAVRAGRRGKRPQPGGRREPDDAGHRVAEVREHADRDRSTPARPRSDPWPPRRGPSASPQPGRSSLPFARTTPQPSRRAPNASPPPPRPCARRRVPPANGRPAAASRRSRRAEARRVSRAGAPYRKALATIKVQERTYRQYRTGASLLTSTIARMKKDTKKYCAKPGA